MHPIVRPESAMSHERISMKMIRTARLTWLSIDVPDGIHVILLSLRIRRDKNSGVALVAFRYATALQGAAQRCGDESGTVFKINPNIESWSSNAI